MWSYKFSSNDVISLTFPKDALTEVFGSPEEPSKTFEQTMQLRNI